MVLGDFLLPSFHTQKSTQCIEKLCDLSMIDCGENDLDLMQVYNKLKVE